jgi:succinyl-CoA synthetase alpha subunit
MILRGSDTVLVLGITGKQGTFWSERMRDYGTKIVGGVNPRRGGEKHLDLPVWASARDARSCALPSTCRCTTPCTCWRLPASAARR